MINHIFYILSLTIMKITYTPIDLPVHIDIGECVKQSKEGLAILSGLLKIDLNNAQKSLLNMILDLLLVHLLPNTTYIPYNFTIFILFSDVMAEAMKRSASTQSTKWFPYGENGPFVNAGLEKWKKSVMEWRSEETDEP